MPDLVVSDVYLRHTDGAGKTTVSSHRVWDAGRFMATQLQVVSDAAREAAAKGRPAAFKVERITHQQYTHERKPG